MEIFAGVIIGLAAFVGLFGAAMVIASGKLNRRDTDSGEQGHVSMFPNPCDRALDDLRLYCPYREKNCAGCEFNLIGGDDDDRT